MNELILNPENVTRETIWSGAICVAPVIEDLNTDIDGDVWENKYWLVENYNIADLEGGDLFLDIDTKKWVGVYKEHFEDIELCALLDLLVERYSISCDKVVIGQEHYYNIDEAKLHEAIMQEMRESDVNLIYLAEKAIDSMSLNSSPQQDEFTAPMWAVIIERNWECDNYDTYSDNQFERALCLAYGCKEDAIIEVVKAGIELGNL